MAALFKNLSYDIYPLFASLALGTGVCGYYLAKLSVDSPDIRVDVKKRNSVVIDPVEEGKEFHEHALRKAARAQKYMIFEDLNAKFGGVPRKNPHLSELHNADMKL